MPEEPIINPEANPETTPAPAASTQTNTEPAEKTYTQSQLNSMMANEKRTARQALLKELGFESVDDKSYKDTVKNIKATLDAGKTQAQLDAEARANAETAKADAEARAARLEMKVAALAHGVNPDFLEDVITLAQSKVTDDVTVEAVLTEFKTKYPSFFSPMGEPASAGTGSSNNPPRKTQAGSDSLGKRLAKTGKTTAKSSYFKN